jgi:hypothetical protein
MDIGMTASKLAASPWQMPTLTAPAVTKLAARNEMAPFIEKREHSCHAHKNISTTIA